MAVQHYQELIAWQRARELVSAIYVATRDFPADERFGLTNQMRRAAVSIAANIAEGQGRGRSKDFVRFLQIANGSRQEVETHLFISVDLGFIEVAEFDRLMALAAEVGRLISGLARSVETSLATGNS